MTNDKGQMGEGKGVFGVSEVGGIAVRVDSENGLSLGCKLLWSLKIEEKSHEYGTVRAMVAICA